MLYELRRYEVVAGNEEALHARFANDTTRIFERLGFNQIGYFSTVIGDGPELTYLLGWESLDQRQTAWETFYQDPEWQAARRRSSEGRGPLVAKTHSSILRPLPFSGLK